MFLIGPVLIHLIMSGKSKLKSGQKTGSSSSFKDRTSEDEFMAAAIGDEEWLRQSVRHSKQINFDKNVSIWISLSFFFYTLVFGFYVFILLL